MESTARTGLALSQQAATRCQSLLPRPPGRAEADSPTARTEAYHRLARLLITSATIPDDIRQVIWTLNSLLTSGERQFEPRAAILLGITAERLSAAPDVSDAWQDLTDAVPAYGDRAQRIISVSPSLAALYYLLAHFPAQAGPILQELKRRPEPADPDDHASGPVPVPAELHRARDHGP